MLLLILGLVLFLGTHAATMARGLRADLISRFGEGGYKGAYTALSLLGIALIVIGFGQYRAGGYVQIWSPPAFFGHITLLLMWVSMVLFAATQSRGMIHAVAKHPQLAAVKIWAFGHLLANGDLGSVLLFGGFLAWAVMARISLKRRAGATVPPKPAGFTQRDWIALGLGSVLWFVLARWLHPVLFGVVAWPGA